MKNLNIIICFTLFVFIYPVSADDLNFDEALLNAKTDENKVLKTTHFKSLLSFYEGFIKETKPFCSKKFKAPSLSSFIVVVKLNQDGSVRKTWSNNDSRFAKCYEKELSKSSFPRPPYIPYFTFVKQSLPTQIK